jgi:hypothetical protein
VTHIQPNALLVELEKDWTIKLNVVLELELEL